MVERFKNRLFFIASQRKKCAKRVLTLITNELLETSQVRYLFKRLFILNGS